MNFLIIFISQFLIWFLLVSPIFFWIRGEKKLAKMILAGLVLEVIIRFVIGKLIFVDRPYLISPDRLIYFGNPPVDSSFFSGHAGASFVIAFAVFLSKRKLGLIFLGIAGLVAIGRILSGVHYLTDILAGAIVGVVIVLFTVRVLSHEKIWHF